MTIYLEKKTEGRTVVYHQSDNIKDTDKSTHNTWFLHMSSNKEFLLESQLQEFNDLCTLHCVDIVIKDRIEGSIEYRFKYQ